MSKTTEANISAKQILHNFKLRKNIPLDSRFIVSSLTNINNELPINLRYPGLIFFVEDAVYGTDTTQGKLYCFESDLNSPILLHNLSLRYLLSSVTVSGEDYTNVLTQLNALNPLPGRLVLIKPLDIVVIYDGTTWKYFSGNYKISATSVYSTIPTTLKQKSQLLLVGTTEYIIKNDLTLSTKLISLTQIPTTFDNDRYFNINGILYYSISGNLYKISGKTVQFDLTLNEGENIIQHNLVSTNILVYYRINNTITTEFYAQNGVAQSKIIDENTIKIYSGFSSLEVTLTIIAI